MSGNQYVHDLTFDLIRAETKISELESKLKKTTEDLDESKRLTKALASDLTLIEAAIRWYFKWQDYNSCGPCVLTKMENNELYGAERIEYGKTIREVLSEV